VWWINSPETRTGMTSAFGECEEHEIMVSLVSDGSVMWPVICKIMNQFPFSLRFHHRSSNKPIRVIWRGYDLYVRLVFLIRSSITTPLVQPWTQNTNLILVLLQNVFFIRSSQPFGKLKQTHVVWGWPNSDFQNGGRRTDRHPCYPCLHIKWNLHLHGSTCICFQTDFNILKHVRIISSFIILIRKIKINK